jgi:hypothetical protein
MKITKERLREIIREVIKEESEYQTFFKKALEKAGKSIPQMSDEEKKAFFNKIDAAWKSKGEKNESVNEAFKHIIKIDKPSDIKSTKVKKQIETLAKKGIRSKEIGLSTGFVGDSKSANGEFQKVKNRIYFDLDKRNESVNETLKKFDDVHIKSKNLSGMVYKIQGNTVVVRTIDGLVKAKKNDVTKIQSDNIIKKV